MDKVQFEKWRNHTYLTVDALDNIFKEKDKTNHEIYIRSKGPTNAKWPIIDSFTINAPQIPLITVPEQAKQTAQSPIPQKVAKAPFLIKASFAIILKYFAIVDLLMDFFGKVNVRLSKRL